MAPERFTKETVGSYTFSSLRTDREQHVPDSSNHSLYLIQLFSFRSLEGNFGGNQQPDGSISLSRSPLLPPSSTTTTTTTTQNTQHHRDRERDTETQRQTEREDKTQVSRTICTSDTFHDVRLKEPLTFHNGFMFVATSLINIIYIYIYICIKINIFVIVNRHGRTTFEMNCVGTNMPQHRHMYGHIVCD